MKVKARWRVLMIGKARINDGFGAQAPKARINDGKDE